MTNTRWSKEDREPYVESWHRRVDNVEDYMESLVDVWHTWPDENYPNLYDFLGLEQEEVTPWIRDGKVSDRIKTLWEQGNY